MSDLQLSSKSSLPFQTSQSNPSLMNEEAPELTPSSVTPHVVTVPTSGKMVAVGSPSPHIPVNTATIPASPIFLPNSAVISQTPMTKPAEGVAPNIPRVVGMDYSNRPMYQQHPMMGGGGVPLRQPQPYPPPPPSQIYPFGTARLSAEQTSQQQQVS